MVETSMTDTGIAVVGKGEVTGAPDTVTLGLGVNVTRRSVAEAAREAGALTKSMMDALLAAGVAEPDIQSTNVSVAPNYDYPPNRQPKLTGYTFASTMSIKIRDVAAAGGVIDAALAAAGDNAVLNGVTYSLDDDDDAIVQARAAAFADAKAKADQLAALAGVRLGPPVAIQELTGGGIPMPPPRMLRVAADAGGTALAPGQIATSIYVSVRFSID